MCQNLYPSIGSVEGKGSLKWFKVLHWMNLLTGEVVITLNKSFGKFGN